jgi:hypothetical protein
MSYALVFTLMPRSIVRAIFEKNVSTRFNHEPFLQRPVRAGISVETREEEKQESRIAFAVVVLRRQEGT